MNGPITNIPDNTIKTLLPRFTFLGKIVFFACIFTILWVLLFFNEHTRQPTGDHTHSEDAIPMLNKQRKNDNTISEVQALQELEAILAPVLTNNENNEHNAGHSAAEAQNRLEKICSVYTDICNKTVRDGTYSPQESLFYQGIIVYLMNMLDDKYVSNRGGSLRDTISYIKLFDDPLARRGSAGHTYVKLNSGGITSRSEFWEVLTHEYGHIVDLGLIQGTNYKKNTRFTEFGKKQRSIDDPSISFYSISWDSENARKNTANRMDFVSGYAMKGVYEDFAETFNLYMNHNRLLRKMATNNTALAKKFQFIQQHFDTAPLQYGSTSILNTNPAFRPWDTTRIQEG